jgi:hypothetical protein
MKSVAALLLVLSLNSSAHDVHVTNARMAVEGKTAILRVRLFHDDFTSALRTHSKRPDFTLAVSPASDSVVMAYIAEKLALQSGGRALKPSLTGSGEEKGIQPELDVWYFDLRYESPSAITRVDIRNELLFEQFRDQRNIIKVLLPTRKERTVFFVPGDGVYRLRW